jgi:hypothetical protein
MPEVNTPPCPTHGALPRSLHAESFEGIVTVIEEIINTVSGVGTLSYARCPYGYPYNFEGVVRALEDLNTSISGLDTGGSNIVGGSGIYVTASGDYDVVNADYAVIVSGGLVAGDNINFDFLPGGQLEINSLAVVSGVQAAVYTQDTAPPPSLGALWYDTNEGRMFVYASESGGVNSAWYQTNAEALAYKGEQPPSGAGFNAPPRDGSLWFNNLLGSLFVYDATSSGWYESSSIRTPSYGLASPTPVTEGVTWIDSSVPQLKVWNGTAWVNA